MNPLRALIGNMLKREPVSLGLVVAALAETCAHAFPLKEGSAMFAEPERKPGHTRNRFGGPAAPQPEDAEFSA